MSVPDTWIEHRRGDRELIGWMEQVGGEFVAVDLLGRPLCAPTDWVTAEVLLESRGIGYLAEPYKLDHERTSIPVRIVEVAADRIVLVRENHGSIDVPREEFTLPFPPTGLRPRTGHATQS